MDVPLQAAYSRLEEDIKNAIKEHHLNHSVISVGLNALLLYPDHAWNHSYQCPARTYRKSHPFERMRRSESSSWLRASSLPVR